MQNSFHYTFDLKGCCPNKLSEITAVGTYIRNICGVLGLNPVGNYMIEKFPSRNDEPSGITACQILSESAITIHSYAESGYIYIDLFSCSEFDVLKFKNYTELYFGGVGVLQRVKRMNLGD